MRPKKRVSNATPNFFPRSNERLFRVWKIQISKINCKIKSILSGFVARTLYFLKKYDTKQAFSPSCRNWPICWLCIDLNHDYFQPSQHFDNRDGSSLSDGVIFLSESSQVHKQSLLPSCQQLQPNIHAGWGSVSRRQYFQHPCLSSMVRFGDWSSYSGENWPNIFDINFLTQNIRS